MISLGAKINAIARCYVILAEVDYELRKWKWDLALFAGRINLLEEGFDAEI